MERWSLLSGGRQWLFVSVVVLAFALTGGVALGFRRQASRTVIPVSHAQATGPSSGAVVTVRRHGCTVTVFRPSLVPSGKQDEVVALGTVRCDGRHRHARIEVRVQYFIPNVWPGSDRTYVVTIPPNRTLHGGGKEPCVPGQQSSIPWRAQIVVRFTQGGRKVRIATPFNQVSFHCI
jgi:hypothetical protein